MFLFRVQMPETPGSLGRVATAMGSVGANIFALEIVDRTPGAAVDDFLVDLPEEVLPDSLIAACQAIGGVKILWVSRAHSAWTISSDIELLNSMADHPEHAKAILTSDAPTVFHSSWAVLLDATRHVVQSSSTAPEFTAEGLAALGDLNEVRAVDLPDGWMPYYGESLVAIAPLTDGHAIVVGRQGGPEYLPSELTRLRHMAALAG
ncbi:MAG: amino acid-binding protein [Propionibacteriaceae bacterium]|jgi:hypothetical protein|nr:amino acid-binding protein [Propionibacteriaceae bacterium]